MDPATCYIESLTWTWFCDDSWTIFYVLFCLVNQTIFVQL